MQTLPLVFVRNRLRMLTHDDLEDQIFDICLDSSLTDDEQLAAITLVVEQMPMDDSFREAVTQD